MASDSIPPIDVDAARVSLVRGGLFYRAQLATRLIGPNRWNLGRRIALLVAVGWLPLVLITLFFNPEGLVSLLRDYRVYARMLIAVPALIFGEVFMESRFKIVLAHIPNAGLLDRCDQQRMDAVIAFLVRVRDSLLPEIALLILIFVHTALSYRGLIDDTPWLSHSVGTELRLTMAGGYAVLVSSTIFQLLLGLALWKWLMWTYFVLQFSRCDLKLVPTHPDEHAGLGFLGLTPSAFAAIAFSTTAVIGATWRQEILHHGAHLMDFKLPAIALIVIIAAVALGPLSFFIPRLALLRRKGLLQYGILGQQQSARFHEKWIHQQCEHGAELLQAVDATTLANYARCYECIQKLNPFPVDRGTLYTLAVAVVVPALPVILAEVPLMVVVRDLLKALR